MEHADLVGGAQRLADLVHHVAHEPERETHAERAPSPLVELGQVDAVDVLLDEVRSLVGVLVHARVHGADDARAVGTRAIRRASLKTRAAQSSALMPSALLLQRLHHDRHVEHAVLREPDVAHAPFAEPAPHLVVVDARAEAHRRQESAATRRSRSARGVALGRRDEQVAVTRAVEAREVDAGEDAVLRRTLRRAAPRARACSARRTR